MKLKYRTAVCAGSLIVWAAEPAQAAYVVLDHFVAGAPAGLTQPYVSYGEAVSGVIVGSAKVPASGQVRAVLWNGADEAIDITPAQLPSDASGAYAGDTDGVYQVGATTSDVARNHALLWSGTAASAIDLHPPAARGFLSSFATGVAGGRQVGYGEKANSNNSYHALAWQGTAASAVDIHPLYLGFGASQAFNTDGTRIVGWASGSRPDHAILWTAATGGSAIDMHPYELPGMSGALYSGATGIAGDQQVGFGGSMAEFGVQHALLWSGSAESVVDLHPGHLPSLTISSANATNGSQQVGFVRHLSSPSFYHATVWSGSSDSAVDLHALLPAQFHGPSGFSNALGIDAEGNVYGWAVDVDGRYHSIEWVVPEPSSAVLLSVTSWALIARRRRRRAAN